MKINLLKDGNGKYTKNLDFTNTWSVSHFFRFLSFAHICVRNKCRQILDVGFGDNTFVDFLEKLGYDGIYHGIDLNPNFVEAAKAKQKLFTTLYETKGVYDISRKYDAVVLGEVIEHIPQSEAPVFLKHIKSILNDGGLVILSTPNKQDGKMVWPEDHEEEFDLQQLTAVCIEAGFNVLVKYGIWNNTENTKAMLSGSELLAYETYAQIMPNSLLNVMFNVVNPERSRQIIIVLQK